MSALATADGSGALNFTFGTGPEAISRQDGAIHLKTKPENSAEINRQLMGAGIGVSELRPFERSLEEVFFQLTGEKQGS